jgi:hypothetical protein
VAVGQFPFPVRLEAAKGKALTQDEMEAVKAVLLGIEQKIGAAQAEFGKKGAEATGLTPDDIVGALPRAGEELGQVDNAIADKAEKQGKKLGPDALAKVRAALKAYDRTLEGLRDELVESTAKAANMTKTQVENALPPKGFPMMMGRGHGGGGGEPPAPPQ